MSNLSVVLFVSVAGLFFVYGLPVKTTPFTYPHGPSDAEDASEEWTGALYVAVPTLGLLFTAIGLLLGCTWCYRHKDCKLFTASATHLHDAASRRTHPPDSGFSEPINNNVGEDNNNGPISLREMQNIANNNAAAYIVSENEERNRASRESVVEFEPLPDDISPAPDPFANHYDWFARQNNELPRSRVQYLREIICGSFGRIVEGDIEIDNENNVHNNTVAVKILNMEADITERIKFLDDAKIYRDLRHENILPLFHYCLKQDPWILIFELASMNLGAYLMHNRPIMETLQDSGVLLRLKCDVAAALSYMHSQNYIYTGLWSGSVMVRGRAEDARAVIGRLCDSAPPGPAWVAPELRQGGVPNTSTEVWSLGVLLWEVCAWGATPACSNLSEPPLSCPYRSHLYQVMQLCWNTNPDDRPTAAQVYALLNHLYTAPRQSNEISEDDDDYANNDFEERWQKLKPNTIPKVDEHVAIVHAPSTSVASHFTGSDHDFEIHPLTAHDTLSVDLDAGVSRSSSIMSDKDPLMVQTKSASLTNLHGSLEDVRNIYLRHSENSIMECEQANVVDDVNSDSSDFHKVDPWLKDIITGSQDDVSYYRDVSDVIKNLDNILNSEKTSSSESSHQASPSRDNLTLDCKKDYPIQSSLVKSPGITNFQNILDLTPEHKSSDEQCGPFVEEEIDRDNNGALSHSFERYSDTNSQNTLENLTPDTPYKDIESLCNDKEDEVNLIETKEEQVLLESTDLIHSNGIENFELNNRESIIPKLSDLCVATVNSHNSLSDMKNAEESVLKELEDEECRKQSNNGEGAMKVYITNDCSSNLSEEFIKDVKREECINTIPSVLNETEQNIVENTDAVITEIGDNSIFKDLEFENHSVSSKIISEPSEHSTIYMDLINNTNSDILSKTNSISSNVKNVIESCVDIPCNEEMDTCMSIILNENESTVYLDLPTVIKETNELLNSERNLCNQDLYCNHNVNFKGISSSTPKMSNCSVEEDTLENSQISKEPSPADETTTPDYGLGVKVTKLEQKTIPETLSPFESPTKSHPTDTFDENSSVVLGPFENCTLEFFKGVKTSANPSGDFVELPKEEQFAFSSNFSELNLETPSPLRDSNFLNEVPDVEVSEDVNSASQGDASDKPNTVKPNTVELGKVEMNSLEFKSLDETDLGKPSPSPSTPPNSPGQFLTTSHQHQYINDVHDPTEELPVDYNSLETEVDLNQIELQITTKLAMAENENNLNIEYSGPLTVEEIDSEPVILSRDDANITPDTYLAGNGGADLREENSEESYSCLEESMLALRNELELKLPLAQTINIEPAVETDSWSSDLPPPPELIVNYPGALSPIAEETGHQLSAYENDRPWTSVRTDSSESYLEPCNNSTDEVTDLPTRSPSLGARTYTLHRDPTSNEITMSVDSLNATHTKDVEDVLTPVNDKTYNVAENDKESNVERISQVSPFILSPTTDSSVPENMNSENVTGVSTLSKTTVPTHAKSSRPSETQCLSKATSIDSWCSNDTLFNVEDNFDDLAMDPDVPVDFEPEHHDHSNSTLHGHGDDDVSHCSTYIIHDSKSECDSFSPDSITANNTNTKQNLDKILPSMLTKSELNDSIMKNTPTMDLAYGTLISGSNSHVVTFSNCTTEVLSGPDDMWKLYQPPEMVRRSPITDGEINITPPQNTLNDKEVCEQSPQIKEKSTIAKMESVDISCFDDYLTTNTDDKGQALKESQIVDMNQFSPDAHYKNMSKAASTPLNEITEGDNTGETIYFELPQQKSMNDSGSCVPNFGIFFQSVELRPQDISLIENNVTSNTNLLLEGESDNNAATSMSIPTYSGFMNSALNKTQDVAITNQTKDFSEFTDFKNSVRLRPQDLSSVEVTSLLLQNEIQSNEFIENSSMNLNQISSITSNDLVSSDTERSVNEELNKKITSNDMLSINDSINIENLNSTESHIPEDEQILNGTENRTVENIDAASHGSIVNANFPKDVEVTNFPITITIHNKDENNEKQVLKSEIIGEELNDTYDSHPSRRQNVKANISPNSNGLSDTVNNFELLSPQEKTLETENEYLNNNSEITIPDIIEQKRDKIIEVNLENCIAGHAPIENDGPEVIDKKLEFDSKYATVNYINEAFEELLESNVDDNCDSRADFGDDVKEINASREKTDMKIKNDDQNVNDVENEIEALQGNENDVAEAPHCKNVSAEIGEPSKEILNNDTNGEISKLSEVTHDFLRNEKQFCQLHAYLPLLSDIRFTGPAEDCMTTSFNEESPTDEENEPEPERKAKENGNTAAELLKEWDSDSDDSHSTNSSSGEFIWKDGDGHVTSVVPSTHFQHQGKEGVSPKCTDGEATPAEGGDSASGSGSDSDELEFVPSSWDCRAAPAKSSLRSLEQGQPDNKKRVVFKRQKYHCVYEYPREVPSPCLPDYSTYSEWDAASAEEAEFGYGQLFSPHPLDYPLRAGVAFGTDYDEDFYISSSARPFESLGATPSACQFFPGVRAPPSPPPPAAGAATPDSGVEDAPAPPAPPAAPRAARAAPAPGEALGGLRHTRDRLKLDLPPSPHRASPSPRLARVFTFAPPSPAPAPSFSTFGKPPPDARADAAADSADEDSGIESSAKAALEPSPAPASPAPSPSPAP